MQTFLSLYAAAASRVRFEEVNMRVGVLVVLLVSSCVEVGSVSALVESVAGNGGRLSVSRYIF